MIAVVADIVRVCFFMFDVDLGVDLPVILLIARRIVIVIVKKYMFFGRGSHQ